MRTGGKRWGLIQSLEAGLRGCRKHCYMHAWLHPMLYLLLQSYMLVVITGGIYPPGMNQLLDSWLGHFGGPAW